MVLISFLLQYYRATLFHIMYLSISKVSSSSFPYNQSHSHSRNSVNDTYLTCVASVNMFTTFIILSDSRKCSRQLYEHSIQLSMQNSRYEVWPNSFLMKISNQSLIGHRTAFSFTYHKFTAIFMAAIHPFKIQQHLLKTTINYFKLIHQKLNFIFNHFILIMHP